MENNISGAYKRKEYGWFFLYIMIVVISARLAGVIGAMGSVLIVSGLYKVIKNKDYSKIKKTILSISYIVGGSILIYMIVFVVVISINKSNKENITEPTNIQGGQLLTDKIFSSASTPNLTENKTLPNLLANLENVSYVDPKYNFIIQYPKGWTVDTSGINAKVEFNDPSIDEVAIETMDVSSAKGYNLHTYAKAVIQNFASSADSNSNLKIVEQGNTVLNGQPAYEFEVTYDYINKSEHYPFHGIYVISINSDTGYVFFGTSFENSWVKYRDLFNASVLSFKFSR